MGRHSIPDPDEPRFSPPRQEPPEPHYQDETGDNAIPDTGFGDPVDSDSGPPTGGHRTVGEWTGSHRVITPRRRGVSPAVIAALVAVVALVGGVILWQFFGDALSNRSDTAGDRCLGGEAKVAVLADPAIADQISTFAGTFNQTAGPVGDKCVSVSVTAADSNTVIDGLQGDWPGNLGEKPAVWIPGSSVSSARLQAAAGAGIVSSAHSVATSPVLLAVRPDLKTALAEQTWGTVPSLQSDQGALDNLGLPGWGSLRLALPTTGDSDAANLAAEAVAAASAPAGSPATSGIGEAARLVAGQPRLDGPSLETAMNALLTSTDAAAAPVHAVAITEQQLFTRANALSNPKAEIGGWQPPGPTPVADFPAVLLSGDWISEEQASGASEFERFLLKPEQLSALTTAGFRTEDNVPPANDVVDFAPVASTLVIGDDAARVSVAGVLAAPSGSVTTSIMLDRSLNLAPVGAALNARVAALPPTSALGLTTFDGSGSNSDIALGPLADPYGGQSRAAALRAALDGAAAGGGGAVSFTTLRNVYADAQANFRPGQPNSVLVITSGPHTDQSLGPDGLQELIRSTADPARPVAVNVINVGADPDRATWEAVAQISGGIYQNVPAADSPDLVNALAVMLP